MSGECTASATKRKRVAILGSTGSIGVSALEVLDAHPSAFELVALTANVNVDLLEAQARRYRPTLVAMADADAARELRVRLRDEPIEVLSGMDGLVRAATHPALDLMLSGIVGAAGLLPTLEAARCGIDIAFVNKEVLVLAGEILLKTATESGARILPVDSEISAIFQCLECCGRPEDVRAIILTASGGPFRTTPADELRQVTPERALKHPNWSMGAKVTIDSATLMNKGFEVIEAHWLFALDLDRIHVVVHPQSIVHSCVEFVDGSILAQLGVPDMKVPIQYALTYPERRPTPTERLNLTQIGNLAFEEPDIERFPCLSLAYEAVRRGGTMPAVLSGADEVAVEAFLSGAIRFDQIPHLLSDTMAHHSVTEHPSIEAILNADRWARRTAHRLIETRSISEQVRFRPIAGKHHV